MSGWLFRRRGQWSEDQAARSDDGEWRLLLVKFLAESQTRGKSAKTIEQKFAELGHRLATVKANAAQPKSSVWPKHTNWAANEPACDAAIRQGAVDWRARENRKGRHHAGRR